jgi:hypothetical protein
VSAAFDERATDGGDVMAKVIAGITMSLDGYITGPNDRLGASLGDDGEQLHYWLS